MDRKLIRFSLQFIMLSFLAFCSSSCDGQIKNGPSSNTSIPVKLPAGTAKLKRFNGATQFDNILCSAKDKNGHLWFGTTGGGVYRYDGEEFVQFTTNEGLSHNDVFALYEDRNGILWIGTANGLSTWDGNHFRNISIQTIKGQNATSYQPATTNQYGSVSLNNAIDEIIQDSKGVFWFGGGKGLFRYDGKTFTNFTLNDGVINSTGVEIGWVEKIVEDSNGNVWFGGRRTEGVFCFDGKKLTHIKPDKENWLWPILKDKKGNVWFSNWFHVFRFDKAFTPVVLKDSSGTYSLTCAFEDKEGRIWFGCDNKKAGKLFVYDGKTVEPIVDQNVFDGFIGSIISDNEGNLWIGKSKAELYRYDGKSFTVFSE